MTWSIADARWPEQRRFVYVALASGDRISSLARLLGQPVWRVRAWYERTKRLIDKAADAAFPLHPPPPVDWHEVAAREAARRAPPAPEPSGGDCIVCGIPTARGVAFFCLGCARSYDLAVAKDATTAALIRWAIRRYRDVRAKLGVPR